MPGNGWQFPPRGEGFILNHCARGGKSIKKVERDNRFAKLRKRTDDARLEQGVRHDLKEVWDR